MKPLLFMAVVVVALFVFSRPVEAQITVFNVPSADVMPKGKLFLQHESQFRPWEPGSFWLGTHYASLGVGKNTEIDTTLFNAAEPASKDISLGVGFKSAIPLPVLKEKFPKREFKVVVGTMIPIGLEGNGVGNWTYTLGSFRLPVLNTRLSGGFSYGTRQIFANKKVSFIGSYEQRITKNFGLQGDWYSGDNHANSLLISGFYYAFPRSWTLYCGYQIPNSKKVGASGFVLELAKVMF